MSGSSPIPPASQTEPSPSEDLREEIARLTAENTQLRKEANRIAGYARTTREEDIARGIRQRFGVFPNFFGLTAAEPEITLNLWGFAQFAYLDNPLPALFKERLFVYLSRFCDNRYCLARHVGYLVGLRFVAGDPTAEPRSLGEVMRLVRRPLANGQVLERLIETCLSNRDAIVPKPDSLLEEAIFACASHVFLQTPEASKCVLALQRIFGDRRFHCLTHFLTYVRTAHYWTKLNGEIPLEEDIRKFLSAHKELAECVFQAPENLSSDIHPRIADELGDLRRCAADLRAEVWNRTEGERKAKDANMQLRIRVAAQSKSQVAALNLMEDAVIARANAEASEQALRRSEEKYRTLFDSIDEGFCIIEVLFRDDRGRPRPYDYRFLDVNPAFVEQTGLRGALGRTIRELVPAHEDYWFEIYGRVAMSGISERFEREAAAIGRFYDVYAFRVGAPGQNQIAVLFQDIAERKREERRQKFLLSLSDALRPLADSAQIQREAARILGQFLGVSRVGYAEDVGDGVHVRVMRNFVDGVAGIEGVYRYEDYGPGLLDAFRAGRTVMRTDIPHDPELSEVDRQTHAAMEVASLVDVPLVKGGRLLAILFVHHAAARPWSEFEIALIQETAERTWAAVERARAEEALRVSREGHRNAEERLRLLVESALEHAILTLDTDRVVKSWNPGAVAIFGYTAEEAIGQTADVIFTPEARAEDVPGQEMRAALEKGRAGDDRWMLRKGGSRFWANGAMLPMYAPGTSGPAIGFVKILRDETVTKEAKEALEASRTELWEALQETERARDEAEAAGRAKDHFLAVLSHELRTPLTPVLLASQMIERRCGDDPMIHEALGTIRRNIGVEARFINDLLDVTRIGYGKFEIASVALDLHGVIRRAATIVQPDCDEKKQPLIVTLEAGKTNVSGDDTRLEQVVCNLLKNASKFTPEAGQIEVHTFNEKGCVVLEVTDSGIGIEAADQALIFDAFAQANQTITQKFGGLGLGLAIAKAIVDGHGGELSVRSPGRDQGATFSVRLPLLKDRGATAKSDAPPANS